MESVRPGTRHTQALDGTDRSSHRFLRSVYHPSYDIVRADMNIRTASSLGFVGCIIHEDFPTEVATICTDMEIAAVSFSILTNIAATGSIGYVAWYTFFLALITTINGMADFQTCVMSWWYRRHRKLLKAALTDTPHRRNKIEKVLWSIVESGVVYVVVWVRVTER